MIRESGRRFTRQMRIEGRNNRLHADIGIQKDVKILARFIQIFCTRNHSENNRSPLEAGGKTGELLKDVSVKLCADCKRLLLHGAGKRIICPYDPKPRCKKCPTYCYREGYRDRIRKVMRFSGAYLIKRGRLDLAIKYFF